MLAAAQATGKPVVVNFLGGDPAVAREADSIGAGTLEDAAWLAVALARGRMPVGMGSTCLTSSSWPLRMPHEGRCCRASDVRGLYSGGTLCSEAGLILGPLLGQDAFSVIDLGDDEYTVGRPHPMIDFRLRNEYIIAAAEDPTTAVILLDIVLGYGSHADPAEALRPALERARAIAQAAGRPLTIVASVCGTESDPQGLARQESALHAAGVLLAPSNAQAVRLAARVVREPANGCVVSTAPTDLANNGQRGRH